MNLVNFIKKRFKIFPILTKKNVFLVTNKQKIDNKTFY